ncbi:lysophospholipase [Palleronia salina]|uniref:Lysophospholipase n=1 Tax=Palleronia salina TaxID=313368 RepID=A0A1M6JCI2_9RHOB|nr:alpha/beta hydrolase [Palleronia salina]SHJ44456.1 lysophospholipase [Palleronia salina]
MEPAPLFDDVADAPAGGMAEWRQAADGQRLRLAHWRPEDARGTVLMLPGRTEYVEKYGPTATEFAKADLAMIAIDWRGQGLSDRMLDDPMGGHVMHFADFQQDFDVMLQAAADHDLPKPWYLLGHSMGGAIGLRALNRGAPVARAAFSSPMWGIQMSASLRPMAWGLSWVARRVRMDHTYAPGTSGASYPNATPFDGNMLTCDRDQYDWMARQVEKHPELGLGGPSLRWLNEALVECRALAALASPDIPCLTVLGSEEMIVDPARIRSRMDRWPSGRLMMVEGGRHECMMETPERRDAVFDALRAHFTAER